MNLHGYSPKQGIRFVFFFNKNTITSTLGRLQYKKKRKRKKSETQPNTTQFKISAEKQSISQKKQQ